MPVRVVLLLRRVAKALTAAKDEEFLVQRCVGGQTRTAGDLPASQSPESLPGGDFKVSDSYVFQYTCTVLSAPESVL